jgi:hypothetical protein
MPMKRIIRGGRNRVVWLPWYQPRPDHECFCLVVKSHAHYRLDFDQIQIIRRVTMTHAAGMQSTRPLRLRVRLAETADGAFAAGALQTTTYVRVHFSVPRGRYRQP